jgi:hypothetical protein
MVRLQSSPHTLQVFDPHLDKTQKNFPKKNLDFDTPPTDRLGLALCPLVFPWLYIEENGLKKA